MSSKNRMHVAQLNRRLPFVAKITRYLCRNIGAIFRKAEPSNIQSTLPKALSYSERFREIVSDPINLLIDRTANAGFVDNDGNVILHNGIKVPSSGPMAYYDAFSDILIINRGVHEPLEEYCFQQLLEHLKRDGSTAPLMIELGAYWGHYSMWMKQAIPSASVILVESDAHHIEVGRNNFAINTLEGEFIHRFVSADYFSVDAFIRDRGIDKITLLHSDLQGYELVMLQNSEDALKQRIIDYALISTHSAEIHNTCTKLLNQKGYIIEVDSEPEEHTTSHDGLLFARSPHTKPLFTHFKPMGRIQIARASVADLITYLYACEKTR